jgi:hypothetical protein
LSLFSLLLVYFLIVEFFIILQALTLAFPQPPVGFFSVRCVPLCTESQDSKRTISEAAVGETRALDDHAVAGSPTLEVTMTVVVDPAMEVAGISTAAASALVVVSSA